LKAKVKEMFADGTWENVYQADKTEKRKCDDCGQCKTVKDFHTYSWNNFAGYPQGTRVCTLCIKMIRCVKCNQNLEADMFNDYTRRGEVVRCVCESCLADFEVRKKDALEWVYWHVKVPGNKLQRYFKENQDVLLEFGQEPTYTRYIKLKDETIKKAMEKNKNLQTTSLPFHFVPIEDQRGMPTIVKIENTEYLACKDDCGGTFVHSDVKFRDGIGHLPQIYGENFDLGEFLSLAVDDHCR